MEMRIATFGSISVPLNVHQCDEVYVQLLFLQLHFITLDEGQFEE
jgi:hypothetical protein